ncbi:toll/interleukin-1 receptor domain-containing protein [Streptomyces sp. NBC_00442]|uniref:toll/interleukin-1 receptor domain-containing protein n=1 Tax=Streptomyces sp. NBC_00442 TaxID=2903651 RepID=UPI002E1EA7ED
MGFQVRSAEQMRRYAFRLDEWNRSLGDGFGWTILLIGDGGPTTREFLLRHGVDLSVKTAHRVRFAFFSDLSERETQRFEWERAYGGRSSRSFLDLLRTTLGRMSGRHHPLDWEGEGWRELRPEALAPFTGSGQIHAHLHDAERFFEGAVPGTDAAAEFAAKLGIGRHVPCLLMFTDLGAPHYHVLPFEDLSASEVYDRVRGWVDAYYEINRELLAHWSSVEQRIHQLSSRAGASLARIRHWPVQRRDDWAQLSLLSESARIARADPDAAAEELESLTRSHRISTRFGDEVRDLRGRVRELCVREEQAARLTRIAERLRETDDPARLSHVLTALARKEHPGLGGSTRQLAKETAALVAGPWPATPEEELFRWWRRHSPPTAKWQVLAQLLSDHGDSGHAEAGRGARTDPAPHPGHAASPHPDHAAFWSALGACPLEADAEDTAGRALAALAAHYGVSPTAPAWTNASANLRHHLTESVRGAQRGAPAWLLRPRPAVLLCECLFTEGPHDDDALRKYLASRPRPAAALRDITDDPEQFAADAKERLARVLARRDAVVRALAEDAHRTATRPVDRATLGRHIGDTLESVRATFRAEVERNGRDQVSREAGIAHLAKDLETAARLDSALRQYDEAVRGVVHPHVDDPLVIPLTGASTVAGALRLGPVPTASQAEEMLHATYEQTREATRRALAGHERAQREGEHWDPDVRFGRVLASVLPAPRAADVLAAFPGSAPDDRATRAAREQRAAEVLGRLSRDELAAVLDRARPAGLPEPRVRPGERITPALVLSVFGLCTAPRVFISYAHEDDGGAHIDRVRALWRLLRSLGIDARLDLPAGEAPQDWALWTHEQYRAADFVLVIASPAYKRRAEGTEAPGTGAGVIWEARLIRGEIYDRPDDWYRRILRVVLPGCSLDDLPDYLGGRTTTYYEVAPLTAEGAERLVRYLTDQPYETGTPIGTVPHLPPRPRD